MSETKNIVIYFGSNLAIEILSYLKDMNYCDDNYQIYVYEENKALLKKKELKLVYDKVKFLKRKSEFKKLTNLKVLIASGDTIIRFKTYELLKKEGYKFFKLIHPLAYIGNQAKISDGCIISPFATVAPFAKIGTNCYLNHYSSAGHHVELGHSSIMSPFSKVNGNSKLGKRVFLGTTSSVLSSLKLNDDSKVSSNSVLTKNLKAKSLAHGNPAKQTKIY